MSLFLRLWIMGTLIALAAAGISIAAYLLVSHQNYEHRAVDQATTIGQLVGHAMAMEPLADHEGAAAEALLASRARELIATGRLLSVTALDPDLTALARETLPGLEEEEALARLGPAPFALVRDRQVRSAQQAEGVIYLLMPMTDSRGNDRGVLAVGVPLEMLARNDGILLFISLTLVLSVLLGLIAAAVLTGQLARPIQRLAQVADRLETGRFDTGSVTPLIGRRDEIGRLARVMLRLVQALDHLGKEMERSAEQRDRQERRDAGPRD